MVLLNQKYEYNPQTDLLGSGGFGRVYRAYDTVLKRPVAIKLMHRNNVHESYSLVAEFARAIEFNHLNLVRYFDAFVVSGKNHLGETEKTEIGVMELIRGKELPAKLFHQIPENQFLLILQGILDGLFYLHQKGIVHRDLKPSNILLQETSGQWIPKILDFGISKAIENEQVQVSRMVGTCAYMAPEQLDQKGMIGPFTDYWAFGVLLYELLIGIPPFGKSTTHPEGEIIANIFSGISSAKLQKIQAPYRSIIQACLQPDSSERPTHQQLTQMFSENAVSFSSSPEVVYAEILSRKNSSPTLPHEARELAPSSYRVKARSRNSKSAEIQAEREQEEAGQGFIIGGVILFFIMLIGFYLFLG